MLHSGQGPTPPVPDELEEEVDDADDPPAPLVFPLLELEEMNIPPSPDDELAMLELLEESGGMLTVPYSSRHETAKKPPNPTTKRRLVAYLRFFMT